MKRLEDLEHEEEIRESEHWRPFLKSKPFQLQNLCKPFGGIDPPSLHGPVKTLKDFTEEEIRQLEATYKCRVIRPKK